MNRIISAVWILILCAIIAACSDIRGEPVEYTSDSTVLKGYLAYDHGSSAKRPGILVVHEWWGHNEYARKRALMLAELGYTALALDMYGEGRQAKHPEEAAEFSRAVSQNRDVKRDRFMAALDLLKRHETVDPEQIAAIGYCFGGSVVLDMARSGLDIDGVVSFHGGLSTKNPAERGDVKARILVCHGEKDAFVSPQQMKAFRQEMQRAGADFRIITYENAEHSFTNPRADAYAEEHDIQIGYNRQADEKSWEDMKDFLKDIFNE